MNLVLDIGNTLSKYSVFVSDKIIDQGTWQSLNIIEKFKTWNKINPECQSIIVSDVYGVDNSIFESIAKCRLVWVSSNISLPFKINYKTPDTLGSDRISLIASAVIKYSQKNCLIIDLGTCITYDFVNEFGEYLGGSISPGFSLRYNSLNTFTSKLPQLEFNRPDNISGNSTDNSIHSGIYYGILAEVKNQVSHYKEKLENLTVILTGGDADKLANQIKNVIFANHNFIAKGLYTVLQLNTDEF
jgi:type III pantothenate kinase